MPFQANNATFRIGGKDIGFVKSISISKGSMISDELESNPAPVKFKTITFTGWVVRPKILKSKGRQPRFVRVVRK